MTNAVREKLTRIRCDRGAGGGGIAYSSIWISWRIVSPFLEITLNIWLAQCTALIE